MNERVYASEADPRPVDDPADIYYVPDDRNMPRPGTLVTQEDHDELARMQARWQADRVAFDTLCEERGIQAEWEYHELDGPAYDLLRHIEEDSRVGPWPMLKRSRAAGRSAEFWLRLIRPLIAEGN